MEKYLNKIDDILELLVKDKVLMAEDRLKELKKVITYDMALKKCNNKYKREQLKAAKALLKNSVEANEHRPLLYKMYKLDDTYQLGDGFILVVLNSIIEGLELNTAEGEYLDFRRYMKTSCGNDYRFDYNYEKVQLDVLELEQQAIKARKFKNLKLPIEYAGNIENYYFNPMYLLRAIRILGTEDVEIYLDKSGEHIETYLESKLGQAVVVGIKRPENKVKGD